VSAPAFIHLLEQMPQAVRALGSGALAHDAAHLVQLGKLLVALDLVLLFSKFQTVFLVTNAQD
jgi:hypothetical protein